ncbi:hypothetical protein [Schleiferilactobacillus perolens]|uniref:Type VII secretion effector n=1 Tax=Schleiferilactobacillus perolens DSM 12744 TaxID=1423792 RepID=A0A0R1N2L8_9LACO|nr:hypothetical protein [Schleiferilactobacillus perolens]KRL11642.1 hypothetical protein FD09_GL000564 [Schleiferilactobacillus perolens DSM 12744]
MGVGPISIDQGEFGSQLSLAKAAASGLHSKNGMQKSSTGLQVPEVKNIWATYDQLTNQINALESLLLGDLKRVDQVGQNKVELDTQYAK